MQRKVCVIGNDNLPTFATFSATLVDDRFQCKEEQPTRNQSPEH